uniref:PdxS/SNZ N-terminal domain-containing protein n=1 Tax=Oryza rufipogon TaxID=4529 RepID=A0A0E0PJW1_ORYRU
MGEIHALRNMDDDEVFAYAKRIAAPYNLVMQTKQLGRLPVVQFAAGGNRYMVMEAFIDTAGKGQSDPLILTQLNSTKAIRDSIQINFGECGLAACLGSLQDHQKVWAAITMVRSIGKIPVSFNLRDVSGSIRACKKAALECEEAKFEYYKLAAGDRITPKFVETMESCFNKD